MYLVPVFSLREPSTDLKTTHFHFQNLSKTTGFRTLHKHYTYENCIFLLLKSLRLFLYFRLETKILKE